MLNIRNIFILSFAVIMATYFTVFGKYRAIDMILDEYMIILAIIPIVIISSYFKRKLKGFNMVDFTQNSQISFKQTVGFFLLFQVIDFYYEGGFIGMISQWFLYWIMGIVTVLVLDTINYYKNYKLKVRLSF